MKRQSSLIIREMQIKPQRYSHLLRCLLSKKITTNIGKYIEKLEPLCTVDGRTVQSLRKTAFLQKTKDRTTLRPNNSTWVYTQKRQQRLEQVLCYHVHKSLIHNRLILEANQVSNDRWMNKRYILRQYSSPLSLLLLLLSDLDFFQLTISLLFLNFSF